jgi:recombinational DNA repair protein RecT
MSTVAKPEPKKGEIVNPAGDFRARSTQIANALLRDWVGEERAREATGRIATAISASAAAAKNPQDFYDCTPQSIAKVIAISALTGIMVSSGQAALAYAIPRRPRKGEPPQLQYQLSHRGIAALAKRAGLSLVAYPISVNDVLEVDITGEVIIKSRDIDNPPQSEEQLRGVMVVVRSIDNGACLSRAFVAKSIINIRRLQSDSYRFASKPGNEWAKESDPWHKWYVEMAIKTAMHYAIGRGWCVIDDTEAVRALQVDAEGDYQQVAIGLEDRSKTEALADRLMGGEAPAAVTETQVDLEPVE